MGKNELPKTFNFVPREVEIKHGNNRLNISLPEPKSKNNEKKIIEKLNMTLPAPKNNFQDFENSDEDDFGDSKNLTVEKVGLCLPSPKNLTDDNNLTSKLDNSNLEMSASDIFPDLELSTSTPQKKKFKRRNESIYNAEES